MAEKSTATTKKPAARKPAAPRKPSAPKETEPKEIIVKQRVYGTNVAKLRTLEFTLDPEKFYAWTFGEPDANTLYVDFLEPPTYAVSLDEEGRLQHVRLNWCLVSTEANPSRWERDVEVYFLSWDDIELEFPELNEKDYPDIDSQVNQ